jgi:branched-chain amino acid transport system substrate-binding protein
MKQAASLEGFTPDTLLPGAKINTTATSYAVVTQLRMQRFKGDRWELFGELLGRDAPRE